MGSAQRIAFDDLDPQRKQLAVEKARERIREIRSRGEESLRRLQSVLLERQKAAALDTLPPAYQVFEAPARYKGAHGGRGSAKSWSFAKLLLRRCRRVPGTRWACIREIQKSLEQSVKRLLDDQIAACGLEKDFRSLNTHIETPGGGIIIFQGMQNHTADSIKSLEGYDGAWVEEAQSLSDRSLTLLRPTIRKPDSELWFTWNPKRATDPVDALLRSSGQPPDSVVREVNYKANPFFPTVLQQEMEWDRLRDVEKYNHVWLGQYEKRSEARVFKNYQVEYFETPPTAAFLFGGDWGFATDPDVLVRMFIQGSNLFIDQEAYRIGVDIEDTPALFDSLACTQSHVHDIEVLRTERARDSRGELVKTCDGMARAWQIVTDSARPETISYMQQHGYPRVTAAKKGPGSVEEGIKFLKNYNIIIHPRCVHTADEFGLYSYKTHALTGQIIPELADKKNHVIDSARYAVETVRNPLADFVTW